LNVVQQGGVIFYITKKKLRTILSK